MMPNLFLSGSLGSISHRKRIYELTTHRLLSIHGDYLNVARQWMRDFPQVKNTKEVEIMLDSGAFTAWSKGQPDIDVKHLLTTYRNAYRNCRERFKAIWFINLDKIPGSPGRTATSEEMTNALRVSDENYHVLKAELGECVLPVFHQSESIERLQEIAEMNPSYICVSPRNDLGEMPRREWSQRSHALLKRIKTHGLAATGSKMMTQVPWHSVDSASWVQAAAYGNIYVPLDNGLGAVGVSEHSSYRRNYGQHLDTLQPEILSKIDKVCDEVGLVRSELRLGSGARELFNAYMLLKTSQKGFTETPIQTTLVEL